MNNKDTIRVLHTEWSEGWGGQEIRIINEMKAVREMGVEVFLACKDCSLIKEKALEYGIKVFTLPFRGNIDFKTVFSLKKIIQVYSIDIINTHSGKDTWVGGLAAKLTGIKFIRTRHLSNKINPSRLNFINELADYIFTTGESIKKDMIKHNRIDKQKIESVPTGIDNSVFNPFNYIKEESRNKFNINQEEIVIGILAVLRQFKRHDLFVKAAKSLLDKYPEKKLLFIIAGDGPQKNNIASLIDQKNLNSRVRMIGHIENVAEFLSAIDILVLCSDSKEGVPQSLTQGLFMNKAVVASDCGSSRDVYFENNFQLVEKGTSEAILKGASHYLDTNYKVSTRQHMTNNFSKSVMVEKIIRSYTKILS